MPYQTDLLVALKDWGLSDYLVEVNGWHTRGSSTFNPGGSTNHHTAGSRRNSLPSFNILVNGRSGLPGPLCNVAQSRSSEFDRNAKYDKVYLVAAGRANHAGAGGWRGLVGNSSVFGLEIEHTGNLSTEPWPERRHTTALLIHNAFREVGGFGPEMVHQHKEWAPTRKIDFIGADGNTFRRQVASLTKTSPLPPAQEEDEVKPILAWLRETKGGQAAHCYTIMGNVASWHPTQESINLSVYLGVPMHKDPLDPVWWKSLAIMNGPLKNT